MATKVKTSSGDNSKDHPYLAGVPVADRLRSKIVRIRDDSQNGNVSKSVTIYRQGANGWVKTWSSK